MVANMTADQLNTWNYDFLRSLGISNYQTQARDLGFLGAWENRENIGSFAQFNPLGTTMGGFGGHTITQPGPAHDVGVKWFPTIEQGAAANAQALMGSNPGYSELLSAFETGTLDQSANYLGLDTWSGHSYNTLTGVNSAPGSSNPVGSGTNNPAINQANSNVNATRGQVALTKEQAAESSAYASDEAQFAREFLGLQEQQLGIQRGGLARQFAEAPIFQAQVEKLFGLEFADITNREADATRNERQNLINLSAQGAGQGSLFTKGARDTRFNIAADYMSQIGSLERSKQRVASQEFTENVQYMEKLAGLQDASKNLDIIAKRYGISRQEIDSRLGHTLNQIENGMLMDVSNLYTQLISTNFGILNPISQGVPQPGQVTADPNDPSNQSYWGQYSPAQGHQ